MNRYARYQAAVALAPTAIAVYCIIALTQTQPGKLELYPFFNWSLFSSATATGSDVVLSVRSVNGEDLPEPALIFDMDDQLSVAQDQAAASYLMKTLDRLAFAVSKGDVAREKALIRTVNSRYLRDVRSAEYDLLWIEYDPIARMRAGTLTKSRILASYEKNDAAK